MTGPGESSEFDDRPYRETRPNVHPGIYISFDVSEDGYAWVFVDGADTRIARQRFDEAEYLENGTYERWLGELFVGLWRDPEGRDQCGECGNFLPPPNRSRQVHAPDCPYYRLLNPS